MSDGSMRSAELWNDGPAFQAALGQMQQFQAQMQRQLQDHMAQIQLQIGSLQQTPQAAYGLAVPAWPPQQVLPQMPLQHVGQAPMPKRTKVRAGRLGRRERAEVKAARATRQAEQKSEGSEAEASGDSWLLEGAAEGSQERQGKKMGAAALRQLMEAVGQTVKAEMEESRKEMREACESTVSVAVKQLTEASGQTIKAEREESRKEMREACESTVSEAVQRLTEGFGQTVKAKMEESRKETKEAYERMESEAVQRLTESFGQTVKTEMEDSRKEVKEAFEKMACEAIQEVTAVVSEHKNKTDDAHARLTTDLKAATPALPGCRSAEAGGASRPQDSSAQRDGARRDEADSFDPSRKGRTIRLTEADAVACLAFSRRWSHVCGKHVVAGPGKYAWQLKIEGLLQGGCEYEGLVIGVAPAYSDKVVDTEPHGKGRFGYIAVNINKIGGMYSLELYGASYGAGDVVTVVLDMASCELSFKKNGRDLGISHRVPAGEYCLAVGMMGRAQSVRIVSSGPA